MATSTIAVPRAEMTSLIRQVQSTQLFNRQLSSICQINGLKSTGVKAELQRRIVDRKWNSKFKDYPDTGLVGILFIIVNHH